jgi:hypothetical protein
MRGSTPDAHQRLPARQPLCGRGGRGGEMGAYTPVGEQPVPLRRTVGGNTVG